MSRAFLLLVGSSGSLADLLHDGVDFGHASWVDSLALLVSSHTADVGGNVEQDGGEGHIDNVSLAEGGGNGEFVFLKIENKNNVIKTVLFYLYESSSDDLKWCKLKLALSLSRLQ